nr:reverse transcriptase domain-containing protein [Tanacetum cinerariifolium]
MGVLGNGIGTDFVRWGVRGELGKEIYSNVQDMSGCSADQKVKYTTGSFVGKSLTWWNSQIRTLSRGVAVSMLWNDFKFMMIEEFCPSHEMQKLETELWNHTMVGAGHAAYTNRFHKLARLVPHLVTLKIRKIERYVYGLALQLHGIVAVMEPKTMQNKVRISSALTDDAVWNGSIKKVEKGGNVGEPSKDKNDRDDNKRTRTGNVFANNTRAHGRLGKGCRSDSVRWGVRELHGEERGIVGKLGGNVCYWLLNTGVKFRLMTQMVLKGSSQNNIDDKGYWDNGCSRHMTGNISYLSNFEPFNGGYVSFGQGGCKITGKGTIKT